MASPSCYSYSEFSDMHIDPRTLHIHGGYRYTIYDIHYTLQVYIIHYILYICYIIPGGGGV
jgi:hypothetical protein